MGSGKTTLGRRLAASLGWGFVDTDQEVEQETGMTIPDIFRHHGEAVFRRFESSVLARVCAQTGQVIATGGGAVLDPSNVAVMRRSGTVIWLTVSARAALNRVGSGGGRPLLAGEGPDRLNLLLDQREPLYRAAAHWAIDTSSLTVNQSVRQILARLDSRSKQQPFTEETP